MAGILARWRKRDGESDALDAAYGGPLDDAANEKGFWRRRVGGRGLRVVGAALLAVFVLYYLGGAVWISEVDDDLAYEVQTVPEGASYAVETAVALTRREVDRHGWTANDPFFLPGAILDNMPAYQQGIMNAVSLFALEMRDRIGRARGSSQMDPDLQRAPGFLSYSGEAWLINASSPHFSVTAESQYRSGAEALESYNRRLAAGEATFERRADNLEATLDRIASDLGSASAAIDAHIGESRFVDFQADDLFYANKGRLYAYYVLLRALEKDYADVLAQRELGAVWGQMMASFAEAAALDPLVVWSGDPDAFLLPSHLSAQGFYLLRARTQMREVSSVLQK